MSEPPLRKYPAEYFGYPYTDHSKQAQDARNKQYCPFLHSECKKPRKSQPEIKVGACSVGYRGEFTDTFIPVIICPHRFNVSSVFKTIETDCFGSLPQKYELLWIPEVSLDVGGSVDFVAAKRDKTNGEINDFVCVEFQAAGTTGTPWEAIKEYQQTGRFKSNDYKFGINWANEFVKTMMQQAYKKGLIIEHWNEKLIFIIQDVGLEYMRSACDTSGLRSANDSDSIYFYTFKLNWNDQQNKWLLHFKEKFSTNSEGIRKILGGAIQEDYPKRETFIQNIKRKLEKEDITRQTNIFMKSRRSL